MKYEFEQIAGYEVSDSDYDQIIEPMYMALDSITKADFVKMLDKKRFALPTQKELVKEMRAKAAYCAENCYHFTCYEQENELDELIKAYKERFYRSAWTIIERGHKNGCTYPETLIIGFANMEFERIKLA
jgi:arginine/lysine/ornithine decarboxylase